MTVVFDLDGTTIFKGQKMSLEITQAIDKLSKKRQVVFASARPIRDMLPVLPDIFHDFDLIGGNGSFIRQNQQIKTKKFAEKQIKKIFSLIEEHELNYMADSQWNYAYQGDVNHPLYLGIDPNKQAKNIPLHTLEEIVKVVLFTTDEHIINELSELDIAINFHGSEALIDLSPTNISKYSAYQALKIEGPFTMFGNDVNDLPMFEKCEKCYVVGDLVTDIPKSTNISLDEVSATILSLLK